MIKKTCPVFVLKRGIAPPKQKIIGGAHLARTARPREEKKNDARMSAAGGIGAIGAKTAAIRVIRAIRGSEVH